MESNTFLHRLALHGPFVIADETFYQVCEKRPGLVYENVMSGSGLELALIPSGSVQDLERFWRSNKREEILDYKRKFVENNLRRKLMSDKDVQNYDDVKATLKFILEEFLPLMIDTAYEMGELLGVPNIQGVKTGRQVIDDLVKEEIAVFDSEDPSERIKKAKELLEKDLTPVGKLLSWKDNFASPKPEYNGRTSTLGFVTDQVPLYFSRGNVFLLNDKDNNTGVVFTINGKKYSLVGYRDAASFDDLFSKEILKILEKEALQDFDAQFEQLVRDTKQEKGFKAFANKPSFNYGNLGYIRQGDEFYVYWEVPKFAMQNPAKPHLCNPYPATKIALKIQASQGKIFRSEEAYCIDPMIHPTLQYWETPFTHICNLTGKFRGHSAENAMADLSSGINAFINGLTMESLIVHGSPDEECRFFGTRLRKILEKVGYITLEEAIQKGYKITNVWYHKEYNKALAKFKEMPALEEAVKEVGKEQHGLKQTLEGVTAHVPITPAVPETVRTTKFRNYYRKVVINGGNYCIDILCKPIDIIRGFFKGVNYVLFGDDDYD